MAEYIEREALAEKLRISYCGNCSARGNELKCRCCDVDDVLSEIEEAPTADVVEVVRCKECVHHTDDIINEDIVWCEKSGLAHLRDYYCADGKGEGE